MLALLSAWAVLAGPPEPGLSVQWDAPAGCPDGAVVRARVVRLVGEEAARKARLTARAAVRAEGGRWALELELAGETGAGKRSLSAGRCEELAGAAALVIAIAVDPRAVLAGAEVGGPAPADGGGAGAEDMAGETGVVPAAPGAVEAAGPRDVAGGTGGGPPAPGRDAGASEAAGPVDMAKRSGDGGPGAPAVGPDEVVPETGAKGQVAARGSGLRFGLRAAAGVGFARILPGPSAAVGLTLSLAGRGWRAEFGGVYAPPVVGGSAQIGGVFQLGAVELRGCPALRRGRFELPLCVGLQLGAMQGSGRGSGLTATYTARSLWLAATLGGALAWRPRERFGLWLQVDAIGALVRPSFVTVGGATVHEAARFGGQALAGVEVRLR